MFERIGTLHTYLRQKNLRFAANYKIRTGQRLSDAARQPASSSLVNSLLSSQKKSDDEITKQKVALIKQKLMSGKKISSAELSYLQEKDPALYRKAKKATEAREELQARLKSCKTKQEARMAVAQAMAKASAEASAELAAAKSMGGGAGGNGGSGNSGISSMGIAEGDALSATPGGANAVMSGEAATATAAGTPAEAATCSSSVADGEVAGMAEHGNGTAATQDTSSTLQAHQAASTAEEQPGQSKNASATDSIREDLAPQSILEKYLMVIRAIEDEWMQFSSSKDYKDLPEDPQEERAQEKARGKKVRPASRQTQKMLNSYKQAMIYMKQFALLDNK